MVKEPLNPSIDIQKCNKKATSTETKIMLHGIILAVGVNRKETPGSAKWISAGQNGAVWGTSWWDMNFMSSFHISQLKPVAWKHVDMESQF